MVENNEKVAQDLAVGTQTLDQLQGVNLTSVGLKRLAWENLPPRLSLARFNLQEQVKHANRNSTLDFLPTSLE